MVAEKLGESTESLKRDLKDSLIVSMPEALNFTPPPPYTPEHLIYRYSGNDCNTLGSQK